MKRLLLALVFLVGACGEAKIDDPVASTKSALTPGSYCISSADPLPGQRCGGYTTLVGTYRCEGQTYNMFFSYSQGIDVFGNWYVASLRGNGFAGANNMNLDCGGSGASYNLIMARNQSPGFNYLSQTTSCRFFHVDNNGQITYQAPVTLLGGNLQYYPASSFYPNGNWATWIVAPNDPTHGVCGNVQFNWTTN